MRRAAPGPYDACLAARDVCRAATACRDLRAAAADALHGLLPPPPAGEAGAGIAQAVSDPGRMAKAGLKAVCAELELPVSGNKPELIVRILDALGLDRPSRARAHMVSLLLEARRQRRTPWAASTPPLGGGGTAARVLSSVVPPSLSEWQARRHLVGRFGDRPGTLDRISRCACLRCGLAMSGRAPSHSYEYTYGLCSALACSGCCTDGACRLHRTPAPQPAPQRAPRRAPQPAQGQGHDQKCTLCSSRTRSPSCNASACGLCCPRNNCGRHGNGASPL